MEIVEGWLLWLPVMAAQGFTVDTVCYGGKNLKHQFPPPDMSSYALVWKHNEFEYCFG